MRIIDNIFTDFNCSTLDFTLINLLLLLYDVNLNSKKLSFCYIIVNKIIILQPVIGQK